MASTLDGSAGAPSGVSQFSNLLNGYAVRPDWKVAGVDYYVGSPSGTALKNPATISMAGVSVDKSTHSVTVSSSNVTLSGYDFGLDGGWQVYVTNNANNVTIQNSNFKVGSNNLMPIQAYYGGTINVLNNTFDGGASNGSTVNAMVFTGSGGAVIEYNRFTNFPNDGVDITRDGDFVVQYNLFDTMGAGEFHTDAIQTYFSDLSSLSIQYNTVYQPPSASSGAINAFVRIGDQQGHVVHDPVAAYNTIIIASTAAQTANVFQWDSGGSATLVNPQIHDNFIDPKGVMYGIVSPTLQNSSGVTNPVTYNNINLTTGKQILNSQYNSQTSGIPSNPPTAPVITDESAVGATQVKLIGTATAGAMVDIYDQGTLIGAVKASSNGSWSYTTSQLSNGEHSFAARATDSLANASALSNSWAVSVTSSGTSSGGSGPAPGEGALGAPVIVSYSNDTGKANDGITSDNTVTLKGTAAANSTVKVFDGGKQIGVANADSAGSWSYTTAAVADGTHKFSATASSGNTTSPSSSALSLTVDTIAPTVPTIGASAPSATAATTAVLTGIAEANSTVTIFDGVKQVGQVAVASNGAWTFTVSSLAVGTHSFTAKAMDAAGNTGNASAAVAVTISSPSTPSTPSVPVIASFSQDSGVAGDKITNDNTLTLTGTAVANSTVKVFDGTTQVGSATANSSGQWTLTTSTLKDGGHSLTATATNTSGQTSAASTALSVTIDTKAPVVPTVEVYSQANAAIASAATLDKFILRGTAEANSTVKVFDGAKQIGTATANSSGGWSFDPGQLSKGSHSFSATATDVAGNVSTASVAKGVNVSGSGVTAPVIASFSKDSGVVGDKITNDNTLTLTGTAVVNGTVKVFDGSTQVGTAKANSSGQWTLTTSTLKDGGHNLTATVTDGSGAISAASTALSVTIDTKAPGVPTLGVYSQAGAAIGSTANLDKFLLKGAAEANSTVKVFDGAKQIGTATANGSGAWSFDTGQLNKGAHSFTATATDAAGNASAASAAKGVSVAGLSTIEFTSLSDQWIYTTIKGTADPNSQIKLYDGKAAIGQVTADSNGAWTFQTKGLSDTIHAFTAQGVDGAGKVVATSAGQAILGSSKGNTLTGTSGDDYFFGNGHPDTFVFAPNFGNDVIKDFVATGRTHDTIKFSTSVFDSFASVLSHASQVGQDVVIASGQDTLTLKNVKLSSLSSHDFQFA